MYVKFYEINVNIRGIVIAARRWEITAIPAATEVSFPSALGITIVFSPSGIAREHRAQIYVVSESSKNDAITIKITGIIISLIIDIM